MKVKWQQGIRDIDYRVVFLKIAGVANAAINI